MISMDQIHRIRDLYYGQDKSLTEIAKIENLDWRTVRKYVDMEDFNQTPQSPDGEEHSSKLDQFKPIIDKWLTDDRKAPRKQRHTARRVHKRLKDEVDGYDCSYRLVAAYVAERKKSSVLRNRKVIFPLNIIPGKPRLTLGMQTFMKTVSCIMRQSTSFSASHTATVGTSN